MPASHDFRALYRLAHKTLIELETDKGLLASGKNELFGCLFGRDSLISALGILKAYTTTREESFLLLAQKIVRNIALLQGERQHIETGEEPGKIIHEYREENHERLTKRKHFPWFVGSDNTMKNYDSVDSTPLFLITAYRTYQATGDTEFLNGLLPNIHRAIQWILEYGDGNADGFIDYQFHPDRTFGGLRTQGWMDSKEALFHEDGTFPTYPIAPVEAQSYAYCALRLWARHFSFELPDFSATLHAHATTLKQRFNERYMYSDAHGITLASALDGAGRVVTAARSSMGHCLWASLTQAQDGENDCIVQNQFIPAIVDRLMAPDMFVPNAGIRTLSSSSLMYNLHGYHNGTIWPHDTSMIAEGFENLGYIGEAEQVRHALLTSYTHFQTPLELFSYDTHYSEYRSHSGHGACRKQAWSAASLLKETCSYIHTPSLIGEETVSVS